MKKITKATFKSFVNKNSDLYLKERSSFSGMTDCVEPLNGGFEPVQIRNEYLDNTLGISGVWMVGHGGDRFSTYEDDNFKGIEVYNCCGCFIVATRK
jgi:hypothetical protein